MQTLESRVRIKAVQMYRYFQDEISALKEGNEAGTFAKSIFIDDFHAVCHAAEELHLRPYDICIFSRDPPVYLFGAPLDDGDTDVSTALVHALFNRNRIFRDVLFNDENHMLPRYGRTADATSYPTSDMRVESYLARKHHGGIIDPDLPAFTILPKEEKHNTIEQIIQFTHMLSGFEHALVRYLKQPPLERCYAHVENAVSNVIDRSMRVEEERSMYADLRTVVTDHLDDPKNMIYKIHNLISGSVRGLDEEEQQAYLMTLAQLPGKLTKLRDRRFAFILQLQEAISPDMARFKKKIPEEEWVEHRYLVPNLAGLLREAKINYAIFVPRPDAVWQYPDPVLDTL